jgi:hypothetical protein
LQLNFSDSYATSGIAWRNQLRKITSHDSEVDPDYEREVENKAIGSERRIGYRRFWVPFPTPSRKANHF